MVNESTDPIHRFATLLRQEWASLDARHQTGLDTEDLLDIFWLANQIQPALQTTAATQQGDANVTVRQGQNIAAPPSASTSSESKAGVYLPPDDSTDPGEQSDRRPGLGAGLSLQVPAANALRSQLEFARAMRPLMQKIASPTQRQLDEEATAIQIAEQQIWSPVLVPAPERWFDLAIVIEDSASLQIWEDTIVEFKALVEQQGAFRQIRTWRLKGDSKLRLSLNWQPGSAAGSDRPVEALLDPTGRRMIWVVSDCTSDLWDAPQIYDWLEKWGKQSPLAIVQLFPERLWPRTALGIGEPMYLQAGVAGATQARLSQGARAVYPELAEEEQGAGEQEEQGEQESGDGSQESGGAGQRSIILPVISLEPEPLSRWVKVTMGAGDTVVAGLKIDLNRLTPQAVAESIQALTPEQQLQQLRQFCATASITAQKLAGLMAAVPVSLPVVHLIQQVLLPQSQQVHVAEVLMSGLLEVVSPLPNPSPDLSSNQSPNRSSNQSPHQPRRFLQFRFADAVREALIDAVPISKTTQVLDTVSAYISERLGLGTRSFTALIATLPELESAKQQEVQPFAELALSTLRRLGGDYRTEADRLAPYLNPSPSEPTTQDWPLLQKHRYQVVTVELEPLQRFEFETAIIERRSEPPSQSRSRRRQQPGASSDEWVITKSSGFGWQRVEDLGDGVQLELVEIIGGSFQMGSPEDEPGQYGGEEDPQHEVRLKDFFIGKYPITQAQWKAVAALPQENRELDPDPSSFKGENRPVERVSWYDAIEFCARLSAKTGQQYDLPTEAEWEYACRAGTTTPFHFGEMITTDLANYNGSSYNTGPKGANRGETTPIASFPANPWGLYDMHGNIWEWCADHWHDNYADKPEELKQNGNAPWRSDDEKARRSLRGGSWTYHPRNCRSALRLNDPPDVRLNDLGFRVVCRAARALQ